MRRTLLFIALLFVAFCSHGQVTATKQPDGNYAVTSKPKTVATVESLTANATKTPQTITDKAGKVHPVYTTKNGAFFYVATSKAGNLYRRYFRVAAE